MSRDAIDRIALAVIRFMWNLFCENYFGYDHAISDKFFDNVVLLMGTNLLRRFSGDIWCPKIGACSSPRIVPDDLEKFKRRILANKPPRTHPQYSHASPVKFLLFTDVHIDLDYSQVLRH